MNRDIVMNSFLYRFGHYSELGLYNEQIPLQVKATGVKKIKRTVLVKLLS